MTAYGIIRDAVRDGRITPRDGAILLEMSEAARKARMRRAFWRGFSEGAILVFTPWHWRRMVRAWRAGKPYFRKPAGVDGDSGKPPVKP
jgi:hypothetical protein